MSETQRAALDRNKENRARLAFTSHTFNVKTSAAAGGLVEFPGCAEFGLAFINIPFLATGVHYDLDEADPDETGALPPQITGFVTDWDQNELGFYTGAYCGVVVAWQGPFTDDDFTFQVDFTFNGLAMKDVDPDVRV